jgi:hypothetical protein
MSIKEKLSPEQWKAVFNAPSAASTYVSMASGGGLEMFQEMFTAGKVMSELAKQPSGSGYGSLVDDLLAALKSMSISDAKTEIIQYQSKDPVGIRAELKKIVADGAAVAATLPDADGYKRWILDMARKVAETKTGGFLGIGGTSVIDEQEQAALDELKAMMG